MIIVILQQTNGIMINRQLGQNKRKKISKKKNKKQRSEFELLPLLETSSDSEESNSNI